MTRSFETNPINYPALVHENLAHTCMEELYAGFSILYWATKLMLAILVRLGEFM